MDVIVILSMLTIIEGNGNHKSAENEFVDDISWWVIYVFNMKIVSNDIKNLYQTLAVTVFTRSDIFLGCPYIISHYKRQNGQQQLPKNMKYMKNLIISQRSYIGMKVIGLTHAVPMLSMILKQFV